MVKHDKKQIIINCEELETRFALLKNGRLEEYEIERTSSDDILPGSIYLGKIVRLEPSLEAAFVDIGAEKNAFLHYKDMLPATHDIVDNIKRIDKESMEGDSAAKDNPAAARNGRKKRFLSGFSEKIRNFLGGDRSRRLRDLEMAIHRGKITAANIPKMFPTGSELLVQVTKGPIGTKGARVTTNLTIPGRYLVLLPYSDHIGLSSKIDENKERDRLRKILQELDIPDGMGMICRTVGEGRKALFFKRDLDMLLSIWHKVETAIQTPRAPMIVYREPTLLERTVRDFLTDEIDEIVIDSKKAYDFITGALRQFVGSDFEMKVILYNKAEPIFSRYKIHEQAANIFQRVVQLPSGGYICIDETEALVAIDINSGKNRASRDQADTILKTNLEAAEEVARQMRLRNIGGQLVIDFIDMRSAQDREAVNKAMRRFVSDDRAKTRILPLSKFGLMEMTRQREHESIQDVVYEPCPYCNGTGRVKSALSMSVEIQRRLKEILKRRNYPNKMNIRVIMNPAILARLKNEDAALLRNLENEYGKTLSFRADPTIHIEEFKLVDPESGREL
ncbi:MAG: Ribonuclease G [Lentisphaerae bacterium ADurb.Bin242]|nr:MAG: Ribonuclease G [Lentisphaerae bacterium ADurb.Bin242]